MPKTEAQRPAVERVVPPEAMVSIANPLLARLLRSPLHGFVDEHLMLLCLRGRRSGRRYEIVVGRRTIGGRLAVLTSSTWRLNLRGGARVEVILEGRLRRGRAGLEEDLQEVARVYAGLIEGYGHERAGRRLGIRINVARAPTQAELVDAVTRSGLSVVTIDLEDNRAQRS